MGTEHLPEQATTAEFRDRVVADDGSQVIAFRLGESLHACDVMPVQEVVTRRRVHALPDMPPRLLGVLRLRGELVPVLDIAPLLDQRLSSGPHTILVIETDAGWLGVATDGVHEVMDLPAGAFRPAPLTGRERDGFVLGVARVQGLLLTLIDLAEILRDQTTFVRGEPS
jgi:purine-binding chemotaxis protein CheW